MSHIILPFFSVHSTYTQKQLEGIMKRAIFTGFDFTTFRSILLGI